MTDRIVVTGSAGLPKRLPFWRVLALIPFALVPAVAAAQVATLDVAVSDGSGLAAAGQSLTLENERKAFSAKATTNAQGRARFNAVPASDGYSVRVDEQTLVTDIRLRANEARAVAVSLPIQNVLVTAHRDAVAIDSIDGEVSASLSEGSCRRCRSKRAISRARS
jgi:hypothetical protein